MLFGWIPPQIPRHPVNHSHRNIFAPDVSRALPVLVLATLVHGVSARAWLEDDGVRVLTEVAVEVNGCSPASSASICSINAYSSVQP